MSKYYDAYFESSDGDWIKLYNVPLIKGGIYDVSQKKQPLRFEATWAKARYHGELHHTGERYNRMEWRGKQGAGPTLSEILRKPMEIGQTFLVFEGMDREGERYEFTLKNFWEIVVVKQKAEPEYDQQYVCSLCGSDEVQHAFWVNPNTDEVFDEFGTWNHPGSAYCTGCDRGTDEGVQLISRETYKARKDI